MPSKYKKLKLLFLLTFVVIGLTVTLEIIYSMKHIEYIKIDTVSNKMPKDIKIISFNVGLLDINLFGFTILKPTDYLNKRANQIVSVLKKEKADIIAIQELYNKEHTEIIINGLQHIFPYHYRRDNHFIRIGNGLLILSKYPILEQKLEGLNDGVWEEKILSSKSIMAAQIAISPAIKLNIINIHPTSGGLFNKQDSERVLKIRQNQLLQAKELANSFSDGFGIILGDFNAGPKIANKNYEYLSKFNYTDGYLKYCIDNNCTPEFTWSSENSLNINGPHSDSISQRIDHIFISNNLLERVTITDSKVIFKEPIVNINNSKYVTLSDHYGVMIKLNFTN